MLHQCCFGTFATNSRSDHCFLQSVQVGIVDSANGLWIFGWIKLMSRFTATGWAAECRGERGLVS